MPVGVVAIEFCTTFVCLVGICESTELHALQQVPFQSLQATALFPAGRTTVHPLTAARYPVCKQNLFNMFFPNEWLLK
jgi:hypothetical protein